MVRGWLISGALSLAAIARPYIMECSKVERSLEDPKVAARWAARMVGYPEIGGALVRICMRESRCTPVGEHEIDAHLAKSGYRGQVALGHLDPRCQPWEEGVWGTVGPWGLSAASHWAYLPDCYSPRDLQKVEVSAIVAARKYVERCLPPARGDERPGWCGPQRWIKEDRG